MDPLVLITGASSGIGQALALRYHQAGWRLALIARRTAEIERWARDQAIEPSRYAVYGADVADTDSIVAAGPCLHRCTGLARRGDRQCRYQHRRGHRGAGRHRRAGPQSRDQCGGSGGDLSSVRDVGQGASLRFIPWQMGVVARLLRMLPNSWFDRLMAGRPRKQRQRTD